MASLTVIIPAPDNTVHGFQSSLDAAVRVHEQGPLNTPIVRTPYKPQRIPHLSIE